MRRWLALLALPAALAADPRLLLTLVDPATGEPLSGLAAADVTFVEDRARVQPNALVPVRQPLELLLLVDVSGEIPLVRPLAARVLAGLEPGDRVALAAYSSTTELVEPFTADRARIEAALGRLQPGASPRLLDALDAALRFPFPAGDARRALVVLSAGIEGPSRTLAEDVIAEARQRGISLCALYLHSSFRWSFAPFVRQTGGVALSIRETRKAPEGLLSALRGAYIATVSTLPGSGAGVEVAGREAVAASLLPLP